MKCKCGHDEWNHSEQLGGCLGDARNGLCNCHGWEAPQKPKPRRRATPFRRWTWDRENDKELGPDRIDYDGKLFIWVEQHDVDQTKNVIALVDALNRHRVVLPAKVRP